MFRARSGHKLHTEDVPYGVACAKTWIEFSYPPRIRVWCVMNLPFRHSIPRAIATSLVPGSLRSLGNCCLQLCCWSRTSGCTLCQLLFMAMQSIAVCFATPPLNATGGAVRATCKAVGSVVWRGSHSWKLNVGFFLFSLSLSGIGQWEERDLASN